MALNSHWGPSRSPQRGTTDEIVSLQLFRLNWVLIAIILGVFCCGLVLTGFRVNLSGYLAVLGMAGLYGYFGHRNTRSVSRNPRVFATLFMLAQIILLLLLLTSISYIAASANLPMQETNLLAFDRVLGLDFRAYLTFVNDRPSLISALAQTYNSIHRQLFVLVLLLPLSGQYRRAAEFVLGFAIALTFTIIISTLVPAIGVYDALGLQQADHPNIEPIVYYGTLRELPLVRDGTTRLLDALSLGPVLTFPSFHAVSAVLYAWAFWPFRWFRIVGLFWNAVMVAASPIGGGHFFADVAAGLIVAVGAIYGVRRVGKCFTGDGHQPMMSPVPQSAPVLRMQQLPRQPKAVSSAA